MDNSLTGLLITLVVVAAVFMMARALMLWYWKVDEQVALAKEQNQLLREIREALTQRSATSAPSTSSEPPTERQQAAIAILRDGWRMKDEG